MKTLAFLTAALKFRMFSIPHWKVDAQKNFEKTYFKDISVCAVGTRQNLL